MNFPGRRAGLSKFILQVIETNEENKFDTSVTDFRDFLPHDLLPL
jgi:hypothetical protein